MTYKKPEPEKTKVKENPDDWWYSLKMKSKIKAKKILKGAVELTPFGEGYAKMVKAENKKHKEKLEKKKAIKAKRILNSNASN